MTALVAGRHQAHRWPQFLPDGRHFLYIPWTDGSTTRAVTLASLDVTPPRILFESQSAAVLAGDQILYVVDTPARLMARPFDTKSLQLSGTPFPLVPDNNVDYQWFTGEPNASRVARRSRTPPAGTADPAHVGEPRRPAAGDARRDWRVLHPIASPDGAMLALERHDPGRGSGDIWTVDLARGAFSRLTSAPGYETTPVWSPDGRVAYASDQRYRPRAFTSTRRAAPVPRRFWSRPPRDRFRWTGPPTAATSCSCSMGVRRATTSGPTISSAVRRPRFSRPASTRAGRGFHRTDTGSRTCRTKVSSARSTCDRSRQALSRCRFPRREAANRNGGATARSFSTSLPTTPSYRSTSARPPTASMRQSRSAFLSRTWIRTSRFRNRYAASPDGQRFLILSLVDRNRSPIVAVLNWRGLLRQ